MARGWGSPDYARARDLCVKLGRPVGPPILRGMAMDSLLRLDLADAREHAVALLAAGERDGDAVILVEGEYVMGVTAFWEGRFREARRHLQAAIDRYSPERRETHLTVYSQDPKVVCLSRLAWTLWFLGCPDEAAEARDAAVALGRRARSPLQPLLRKPLRRDRQRGARRRARASATARSGRDPCHGHGPAV